MTGNGSLFLVLSIFICLTGAQNWWESGKAVDITMDNVDQYLGGDKHVFVDFFAQYCFHCMHMYPQWELLAEMYMGENPRRNDIIIAKLDGGVHQELANRYTVRAFPYMAFFPKGNRFPTQNYNGMREAGAFAEWLELVAGPEEVATPLNSLIEEIKKSDEIQEPIIEINDVPEPKPETKGPSKEASSADGLNENVNAISEKLDYLVEFINSNNVDGQQTEEHKKEIKELKALISEINLKFDKKVQPIKGDINFSHGFTFLLLGIFLGIGISFAIINFQKLNRSKKLLD